MTIRYWKQYLIVIKKEMITIILMASLLAAGLFYEYAACIAAGICGICLCCQISRKGRIRIYGNPVSLALVILVAGYLLSCLYGVDRGMSLIGVCRMLGVLFFMGILMQTGEEERQKALLAIPFMGILMTVVGLVAYLIPPLYKILYVADRLGGFFQYPNVFAIFCLVGIILLADRSKENTQTAKQGMNVTAMVILTAGILMSGSRTVFLLFLLSILILTIRYQPMRKPLLLLLAGAVIAGAGYGIMTGNIQNIGRILSTSLSSSTLVGRILYAKDGVRLLANHSFGLGYLGYYYMEPEIQTGLYSVRFIHNDWLQLALDTGVIPGVFFMIVYVKSIISKRLAFGNRLILAVMGLHFLMDLDLEFVAVWYLLLLILDPSAGKEWCIPKKGIKRAVQIGMGLTSMAVLYVGIAMIPRYAGNPKLSSMLLPFYTESNVEILAKETDTEAASELAREIVQQNSYIPEVYDVLAVEAYQKQDYEEMTEYKKKSLGLQKYNMDAYNRYVQILGQAVAKETEEEDVEHALFLLEKVAEVPEILKDVEEKTDSLAYKTKDSPEFSLSEEVQEYIRQAKEILQ